MDRLRVALSGCPILSSSTPPSALEVVVILPVHNAGTALEACLTSLALHTKTPFKLIVIDDGSTAADVPIILRAVAGGAPQVTIVRHDTARGFVRSVNEGFGLSTSPYVVILNSDTVVTHRWLEKLVETARSRPNVATVTPLTNNGAICSVPQLNEPNEIPAGWDVDSLASLVERRSLRTYPETPTGVGFCLLITRQALNQVGTFDAEAFGRGYGEENDFSQRAIQAGLVNLIADHAFVYHAGGRSFGDDSTELIARNLRIIHQRYPNYARDIAEFSQNDPLGHFRADLGHQMVRLAGTQPPVRLRVLHLLHRGGGTETHARDLAGTDDPDIVSYVSSSDGRALAVDEYWGGVKRRSWSFPLETPLGPCGPLRDEGYRRALMSACLALRIDAIHVHHLIHNTVDIADVTATLGIQYAVTLHDYYLLCPAYTLLDQAGEPCGACIGRKPIESAAACMQHIEQPTAYVAHHQQQTEAFLNGAVRLFAPNPRVREIFGERFPALQSRIDVVEHGHQWPLDGAPSPAARLSGGTKGMSRLDVALIGGIEAHKGLAAFRTLLRANRRRETTFHLYGWTPDPQLRGTLDQVQRVDGSSFVYHGPYDAGEIVNRLRSDRIHLGLHLAVWEETFSFTLCEFAAAGVPVVAGDLGAQGERVRRCKLGWIVQDPRQADQILQILDGILDRPGTLDDAVGAMRRDLALPGLEPMWKIYAGIYREMVPARGATMEDRLEVPDALLNRDYVSFLARNRTRQSPEPAADPQLKSALEQAKADVAALQERLRSPRHRVADAAAGILHKIPIIWPLVAKATDAFLRRERRRQSKT